MYFMDRDSVSHLGTSKKINEDCFVIADVRPETTIRNTNLEGLPTLLAPTIRFIQLEIGDSIAVCTDGVTNTLSSERLIEILSSPVSASADAKNTVAVHFTQDRERLQKPEQR